MLPKNIFPEAKFCQYGYRFDEDSNLKLEKTGIVIYTENDVLEFKEHKVYSAKCAGSCECKAVFDGREFLLLNIINRYFIHYGLLYEYSELMTQSRNTLHGFLRKLERVGSNLKYHYHIFHRAWNVYLRNVEINYNHTFSCPICKDKPDIITLDGISMGTILEIPTMTTIQSDHHEAQSVPLIPVKERVYISDPSLRKTIIDYCKNGLTNESFAIMLEGIEIQGLTEFVLYTSCKINDGITIVDNKFPQAKQVLYLLIRNEPLAGVFQMSFLTSIERALLVKISQGVAIEESDLSTVYRKSPTLKLLLTSLPPVKNSLGLLKIHHSLILILHNIISKIRSLYGQRKCQLEQIVSGMKSPFEYFPTLTKKFKVLCYGSKNEIQKPICSKIYPKHQRFSPGLLIMSCEHKICYGFQILRDRESTTIVFNLIVKNFIKPPAIIIYDNACNLHNTCLMREPAMFSNTTFFVDRFHTSNHTCNSSYNMKLIDDDRINNINSQVCEQINSSLRRISTQVAYMKVENIFYTVRYFLSCINQQTKQKL